jgi:hypothetical protein
VVVSGNSETCLSKNENMLFQIFYFIEMVLKASLRPCAVQIGTIVLKLGSSTSLYKVLSD